MAVFGWSVYNGATYYIDVFGKRFEKELEQLKNDVSKWQSSPSALGDDIPPFTPQPRADGVNEFDQIPMLDGDNKVIALSGSEDGGGEQQLRERKRTPIPEGDAHVITEIQNE